MARRRNQKPTAAAKPATVVRASGPESKVTTGASSADETLGHLERKRARGLKQAS